MFLCYYFSTSTALPTSWWTNRSTGTVQTSAKPRLTVSRYRAPVKLHAVCSAVAVALSWAGDVIMDVIIVAQSSFPYLPIVANPENNLCIQTVCDPDRHHNSNQLFTGPLPTFSENVMPTVKRFLCKVANKRTNRQTQTKTYPPWPR